MKGFGRRLLLLALVLFAPIVAFAQAASLPNVDAAAAATGALQALQSHSWTLLAGFVVMLLVKVAGMFGLLDKLPKTAVPWVAIGVGALFTSAVALTQHMPLLDALFAGVQAGVTGVGLHEAAGQHAGLAAVPPS